MINHKAFPLQFPSHQKAVFLKLTNLIVYSLFTLKKDKIPITNCQNKYACMYLNAICINIILVLRSGNFADSAFYKNI